MPFLIILLACASLSVTAMAGDKPQVDILVKGTKSWDGAPMSYPDGTPEITVAHYRLTKDTNVPVHCHPMPLAGVITKGAIEVFKENGGSRIFREGDAVIEMMKHWHRGMSITDEAEFIVVYAGAEGIPTTIKKGDSAELKALCAPTRLMSDD